MPGFYILSQNFVAAHIVKKLLYAAVAQNILYRNVFLQMHACQGAAAA